MSNQRALLAAAVLAVGAFAVAPPVPAAPVSKAEQKARAECVADIARRKLNLPPSACQDPRSRINVKMFGPRLESCERARNIATGELKANRCPENDVH